MSRETIERECAERAAEKAYTYFARPDAKRFYVFPVSRATDPEPFAQAIRDCGLEAEVRPSEKIECDGEHFVTYPMIRVSRPRGSGVFIPPRLGGRVREIVSEDTFTEKPWRQAHPEPRFRRLLRRALAEARFVLGMFEFWILFGILGWAALSVFLVERWS